MVVSTHKNGAKVSKVVGVQKCSMAVCSLSTISKQMQTSRQAVRGTHWLVESCQQELGAFKKAEGLLAAMLGGHARLCTVNTRVSGASSCWCIHVLLQEKHHDSTGLQVSTNLYRVLLQRVEDTCRPVESWCFS